MKKMIYPDFVPIDFPKSLVRPQTPIDILDSGIYKGRHYYIARYFLGYPLAYVESNEATNNFIYNVDTYEFISVHGGITFCDKIHWALNDNSTYIGWDYAHLDMDYVPHLVEFSGKKWKTEEILEDVHSVIEQLNKKFNVEGD